MRQLNKKVWPYQIILKDVFERDAAGYICNSRDNGGDIYRWCNEIIGEKEWYSYFEYNDMIYAFKDEASLLLFKITWRYNGN